MLGQVAVTTGISFGLAGLVSTTATLNSSYSPTAGKTIGIYAAILVSHATLNSFGVRLLRFLNNSSIVLHSLGVGALAVAVLAKAPTHQSAKFVFATFHDGTGDPGWSVRASPAYVAACGVLLGQYTQTGFDGSAHVAEETHNAAWSAALGIITSVCASSIFGFFLLLALLFSIQDFTGTIDSPIGQPVTQILVDIFGTDGAIVLMVLIMSCVWHAGLFSMTSNSRMMFAFSRDGALPKFFHKVDARFQSPIRTSKHYAVVNLQETLTYIVLYETNRCVEMIVWLAATLSFLLAVPSLGSSVAFAAATSIATIGLYISYGLPMLITIISTGGYKKGPFQLGILSRPVGIVAVLWIGFISVIFCLPTANPVTSQTLNYTPVAVGIIAVGSFGSWFLWAKKWFKGPIKQVEAELTVVPVVGKAGSL